MTMALPGLSPTAAYDEELRRLREKLRTTDPLFSDEAFLEAQRQDAQQSALDRASAALQGAFTRRPVEPVQRPSQTQALLARQGLGAAREERLAKLGENARAMAAKRRLADPSNPALQVIRGMLAKRKLLAPEAIESLTLEDAESIFPFAKADFELQEAEAKRAAELEQEGVRAGSLRDLISRRYPQLETQFGDALRTYNAKALEQLISAEEGRYKQQTGITSAEKVAAENRAATTQTKTIEQGRDLEKEARNEARKMLALAGPEGAVPKSGRRPSEQDSTKFAESFTMLKEMRSNLRQLRAYVERYGPREILSNPELRGPVNSLVAELQLQAKNPGLYALGVLAGPDVGFLQRVFPEATSPKELALELLGQSAIGSTLEEGDRRLGRGMETSKSRFGYATPGDADYEAAKREFDAYAAPGRAPPSAAKVRVYNLQTGESALFPPEKAAQLASDPRKFSLTPPRR